MLPFNDKNAASNNQPGMKFGYARVSRTENDGANLETQVHLLKDYGIREHLIYGDIASGKDFQRPKWQELLKVLQPDDIIVATHLDRLSRNVLGGLSVIKQLGERGVGFIAINEGIDTSRSDPSGELVLTVMLGVAEWIRSTTAQRSREGVARARAMGRYPGRPAKLTPHQQKLVRREYYIQNRSVSELCRDFQCSRTPIENAIHSADPDQDPELAAAGVVLRRAS